MSDEPASAEGEAPRGWRRAFRSLVRGFGVVLALGTLVLAAAIGAWLGPYVRDDLRLDRIVRVVALDWRDFGHEKATSRLQFELDRQRIGLQVRDQDCVLVEESGVRTVVCTWAVQAAIPVVDVSVPLSFASRAEVGVDGALR